MVESFGIINFPAFLLAGILLNLTPGSDTMYILARSMSLGKKAGILSALGISSGGLVHTAMAACGLSVILAKSATAFLLVKYSGACYLIYLGVKALRQRSPIATIQGSATDSVDYLSIYFSGLLTNVLNPKVALFFLAFLPQFIVTDHPHAMLSFLILGATFVTTGTIWGFCLAMFASLLVESMTQRRRLGNMLQKTTGMVFIGLGLKIALEKR